MTALFILTKSAKIRQYRDNKKNDFGMSSFCDFADRASPTEVVRMEDSCS